MKAGDLVKFKNCSRTDEVGIVIHANGTVEDGVSDVHLVTYEGGKQMWFTTNQLEVISEGG
jgi:hypothetical protein